MEVLTPDAIRSEFRRRCPSYYTLTRYVISCEAFETLVEELKPYRSTICGLILTECQVEFEGLMFLITNIKHIDLVDFKLDAITFGSESTTLDAASSVQMTAALAVMLKETNIEYLGLTHLGLYSYEFEPIINTLVDSKVEELDLSFNLIGEHGASELAKVLPFTKLTELMIGGNMLGKAGTQCLCAAVMRSPKLKKFSIPHNHYVDSSICHTIRHMIANSNLEGLSLCDCTSLPDEGLREIALGIKESLTFTWLYLEDNRQITDESTDMFFRTIGLHNSLEFVYLHRTSVSLEKMNHVKMILQGYHSTTTQSLIAMVSVKVVSRLGLQSKLQMLPLDMFRTLVAYIPQEL
jgi:hypothetical protein